jgi:hypothetical protein
MLDSTGYFAGHGCEAVWTSNQNKLKKSRQLHTPLNPKNYLRKWLIFKLIQPNSAYFRIN